MASLKPLEIDNFRGGMNTAEATTIKDNECADMLNIFFDLDGVPTTRRGSANFGTEVSGVLSQHSLQTHKKSDGTRYLLLGAGTSIYQYDEGTGLFSAIKTGLTSGQRFSSVMYKDVIYITNGVDNFMGYDGTTITEYPLVPKGKYLTVANDVAYLAGVSGDSSIVYYTNANPADLTTFPNNEPINEDNGEAITGISSVGPLLVVFKERSNYIFNSATPSVTNTDYDGGCKAGRTIVRVENDTLFLSENGIFSLSQREGTTGAVRGTPKSDNIRSHINGLTNKEVACSAYWPKTSNLYFAVDDEDTGTNRAIYVLSLVTNGWTRWKGVNANEFCIWEDTDGVEHLLAANPYGGQTLELETGFTDQENPIAWRITSKKYDFGSSSRVLIYERIDFGGFHSEQSITDATVAVTNVSEVSKTKQITYSSAQDGVGTSVLTTLGSHPLGSAPLGGGSSSDTGLTMYPFQRYMPLYFTGRYVGFQLEGDANASAFSLTKVSLWPQALSKDTVPQGLYI